ncbi:MAG: M67 family metallopeptidase [Mariprofundales bacterium]
MKRVVIPTPKRFNSEAYTALLSVTAATNHATIASCVITHIEQSARDGYPHEVCGLLIGTTTTEGNWIISEARQVKNLNHERAADRFQLDPAGYQTIDRELRGSGSEILGVFHSHPDCPAKPSPTDLASAWEGFLYPIVSICKGEVAELRWWTLASGGKQYQQVTT